MGSIQLKIQIQIQLKVSLSVKCLRTPVFFFFLRTAISAALHQSSHRGGVLQRMHLKDSQAMRSQMLHCDQHKHQALNLRKTGITNHMANSNSSVAAPWCVDDFQRQQNLEDLSGLSERRMNQRNKTFLRKICSSAHFG